MGATGALLYFFHPRPSRTNPSVGAGGDGWIGGYMSKWVGGWVGERVGVKVCVDVCVVCL